EPRSANRGGHREREERACEPRSANLRKRRGGVSVSDLAEVHAPSTAPRFDPKAVTIPVLVYAVSRGIQLALVAWMAPNGGGWSRLLAWDGGWFVRVARDGYPRGYTYNGAGELVGNGLAFFPGYPLLARGVHLLTGLSFEVAAVSVSWLAGAAAAILVYA